MNNGKENVKIVLKYNAKDQKQKKSVLGIYKKIYTNLKNNNDN